MMRRFLAAVIVIAMTGVLVAVPASADDKGGAGDVAADPCNSRLAVQVGSDGRFNMGAFPDPATCGASTGSWDIMFRWPESPWSSFSTLRIDGADNVYGGSGSQLEAPNDIDAVTNRSKWQIGDIEVTQTLQIVLNNQTGQEDVAKIAYTVRNTGVVSRSVGLRTMIDTELNLNDGAPFRVPGVGIVTTESEFTGAAVPDTFQAFFDLTDSEHVTSSTLKSGGATAPDRLVLANWVHLYNTVYDYNIDPNFDFTDPFVARPDSAYAVYWNPSSLAPGDSRTYVTFYGLAQLNVNLLPPLALGVTGPATLSVVDGQYSPNPFDVVATVFNNGTATATNVQLTLNLPAGLSLAGGSATQSIGDLAVGQERQVSWSVLAGAQSSETTLTYSVTAVGSNTEPKTVERQVTLPALVGGILDYFALGDSVASGHGLIDDGTACRRSSRAYPNKVESKLESRYSSVIFFFFACSGATVTLPDADDLAASRYKWLDNQVDDVLAQLSDRPTLVSITIGANDFHWGDMGNFLGRLYWNNEDTFRSWADRTAEQVERWLEIEVRRLLAKPNVAVVVTEYHNPFNTSSILFRGGPGNRCLFRDCYGRTEYGVHRLNSSIIDAWVDLGRPARLQIAAVHGSFHGHESPRPACGNDAPGISDTWVQYRGDPDSNSNPEVPGWLQRIIGQWTGGDCFHPNDDGAATFGDAVNDDAVRLGR